MRVAANDDVNPARDRIELQSLDVVQDIDAAPAEGYHLGLRILLRPVAGIDVPSDRNDRRNPLESGDNVRRTDVADVDNMRHACEALLDLRTQEPVSVRDDSNSKHCATIPRCPTVWTGTRPIRLAINILDAILGGRCRCERVHFGED